MVTVTISPFESSDIKYTGMPSFMYQNVIALAVGLSIRRGLGVFMDAVIRGLGAFGN
jgi:hypothetical protein